MSSSPKALPVALHFSQPPSNMSSDHAVALAWLKTSIASIYLAAKSSPTHDQPPTLARSAYLHLYSTAHEYTDSTKTARESPNSSDLYHFLYDQIMAHCAEVRVHLDAADNGEGADGARPGLVANVLRSLDRTHIQQMISKKRQDWHYIKDLHKLVWKDEILQLDKDSTEGGIGSKVASAMAALQKETGDEVESDKDLVERVLKSLEALDRQLKAQDRTLKESNAKACC